MTSPIANPMRGIAMKVLSLVLFVGMQALIKAGGEGLPTGEITFFRSAFAILPILAWLAWRSELKTAFYTQKPLGHFYRGFIGVLSMAMGFYGILHLPLPETIALNYAMPLFTVIAGAVLLKEEVRRYRWTAVLVGFVGVMIIVWPRLTLFTSGQIGLDEALAVVSVLCGSAMAAIAMVQVKQLVRTERTPTIVLYFSVSASLLSLLTIPAGWHLPDLQSASMLICSGLLGGVAQILLTESYRHADVSAIAPFEYTSIIWGTIISYYFFAELPSPTLMVGVVIVIGAGIFILYRERQLAVERHRKQRTLTP